MNRLAPLIVAAVWFGCVGDVCAELKSLDIHLREPFAGGMSFGDVGPYDRIVGVAKFEIDPAHPRNRDIVDLHLAPRNAAGKVEFESDVYMLAPHDPTKGNGAILYDVNNRGRKLALRFFNHTTAVDVPTTAEHAGDGFLMPSRLHNRLVGLARRTAAGRRTLLMALRGRRNGSGARVVVMR